MLADSLEQHRILIVGGSGGVGKTSLSAAIGIAAARAGHRTLVLTIDPARRLAAALGLEQIGGEIENLTARLAERGLEFPGELHAMMLDVSNTLDRAVARYASSPEKRDQILANRLYRNIAGKLSGSQEYAAMQQLEEIAAAGEFDRIILDTPPTTQALDFLTAPERLHAFFDSRLIQVFIQFGGRTGRGFLRMTDVLFRTLERLTGAQVIRDITEFFQVAESILEPFSEQSKRAQALLRDVGTTFLIVTGPHRHQLDDAEGFQTRLAELEIDVGGLIINRWMGAPFLPDRGPPPVTGSEQLAERVAYWSQALNHLAGEQAQAIESFEQKAICPVHRVAELQSDIHSLSGLVELSERLLEK